ncbi:NgoBV family restriction endonuclease [Romboutsia ilealis]|jgi:hypothetical protein|uniref:NgoBV family restriction endonuclease n=1 Tax=Romboutsia ilealis TaxID=1115758 RepID=UPI0026F3973A|nr:NgoBV family restriction endonuclease [Romboutsia ilealis]
MKLTAQEIYDKLVNEQQILTAIGQIRFHLLDVEIVVKRKDVVGNIIQEWLEGWLIENDIEFSPNPNTQMPPDIFLNPENTAEGLLEIKAFNRESSPAFDIADFKAFINELIEKPYHLDTDYLIFGYVMDEENGDVVIKDVWLKKLWEITRPMENWPITVQYKNNILSKMRPGTWYGRSRHFKFYESKEDYLAAFEETIYQYRETRMLGDQWRNRFKRSYRNHYGVEIEFPQWREIKDRYIF